MKTKGFIYIISILFVVLLSSCEEDHIMTKFNDTAGFVQSSYFISAKSDFTYLEIPICHRSIDQTGSKAEIQVIPAEGTPANLVTLDKTIIDFDLSDTVIVKLTLNYNSLIEDQVFSVTIGFTDKYLQYGYGGYEETVVEMTKWRARRMSDFVGTYDAEAISGYSPGSWDEEWTDITTVADATDNTKLLITGIAGSTETVEAFLDFDAMTITIPAGQLIGDVYGYGNMYIFNFDGSAITSDDLVGTLYESNDFYFEYMVPYQLDEGWDWDIFTTTFYKQ